MRVLIDRLKTCQLNGVAWLPPKGGAVTFDALTQVSKLLDCNRWFKKRIALGEMPILELACALILLDGLAEVICLLPKEVTPQERASLLAQAKIDLVIEGSDLGFSELIRSIHSIGAIESSIISNGDSLRTIETIWMLPTSGTSGIPKLISHTLESLTRTMTARNLSNQYVWGSLYSIRRFAGLQVFLQSWISQTPLILLDESQNLFESLDSLIKFGCNSLSATPSMWRKLSMIPRFNEMNLNQITLGGEIVDQPVLSMLSNRFPVARITHIYASTEAGVGIVVRDKKSGFPMDLLSAPQSMLKMQIDENDHLWFEVENTQIKGKQWIDSGDVVKVDGDRVYFLGRANGSINVGGNKVMPEEVESVIKQMSEVAFVQVRAKKSPIMGSLIEAVVTMKPGHDFNGDFKKRLIAYCRTHLNDFKVPAFVIQNNEITLSSSGKLSRVSTL